MTEYEPNRRVVLRGSGSGVEATDDIRFDAAPTGTRVDYVADIRLRGVMALATPFVGGTFKKIARGDLLSSALDSYLSLQSNRLNQIVKVLTIASITLMSAALIAGIYGMNFDFMPELHWRYGYPFAILLMVGMTFGLIALFKRLKWL